MRHIPLAPIAAAIICVAIALAVFGPGFANPQDLIWLQGDTVTSQFAWQQYRHDPNHYFPIVTDRASYPLAIPLAVFGSIPLIDLVLKPLSPILPAQFQYLGPAFAISVALQALLGWALLREATPKGDGPAYKLSLFWGALLFGVAPVMLIRFYWMHISLTFQWPVLLGLLIYLRSYRMPFWRTIRDFSAVSFIAASIMPYIWVMVLLVYGAYLIKSLFDRALDWPKYVFMVIPLLCGIAALLTTGLLELGGLGAIPTSGFGRYSANFLSLIDPLHALFGSGIIPDLGVAGPGQYEGFGYLGLGVIFLVAASAVVGFANRQSPAFGRKSPYWPLLAVALVAYVFAMSNVMAFGTRIIEVPLPQALLDLLQNFRSAGRFVAVPVYILTLIPIAIVLQHLKPVRAALLISVAVLLQTADLAKPFAMMHQRTADRYQSRDIVERFTDPAYQGLGRSHDTLLILPPWQCREWGVATPDYPVADFVRFTQLAMDANLRTNSFYGGRLPVVQGLYHCDVFPRDFNRKPTSKRTAYLLTLRTFGHFGAHIAKTHQCDFGDGMYICRADGPAPGLTERARRAGEAYQRASAKPMNQGGAAQ